MEHIVVSEVCRSVDGYLNYQVSNIGRVRNSNTGMIKRAALDCCGYYRVGIASDGKETIFRVHKLVANEFLAKPDSINKYDVEGVESSRGQSFYKTSASVKHFIRHEILNT